MTNQRTVSAIDLKDLRKEYLKNKASGNESFNWRGHELFVPYAGYLIEYLEGVLDK